MAIRDRSWSTLRRGDCDRRLRLRELEQLEPRIMLAGGSPYDSLLDASGLRVQDLSSLSFEPNVGQATEQVDYVARGLDYSLSLTGAGSVLNLRSTAVGSDANLFAPSLGPADHLGSQVQTSAILRTRWVNGNPEAEATGLQPLPGVTNYLLGEAYTHTGIPNHARVRYDDVYPGIDLVYYGREGELEYDWVVSPGADPAQIVMGFDGMQEMSLDDQGRLVLTTPVGTLFQQAPVIYQEFDGNRHAVDGRYVLTGSDQVVFEIGSYDTVRELVIDPVLIYSTYLGGSPAAAPGHGVGPGTGNDVGSAIATDAEGNTYVTGYTSAIDFPTVDALRSQHPHLSANTRPGEVAFVTKLDPAGVPVFSSYIGQVFPNSNRWLTLYSNDIALDEDGEVYIVGNYVDLTTESREDDFVGIHSQLVNSELGAFVANLSSSGGVLEYMERFGGETGVGDELIGTYLLTTATGVVVDESRRVFVTGYTTASDFPSPDFVHPLGTFQSKNGAQNAEVVEGETVETDAFDAFVVRIDQRGVLDYATYLGGRLNDFGEDIALDNNGNVVVVGTTESDDFPGFETNPSGKDGFIAVLDPFAISPLSFSTNIGSVGQDEINSVAVGKDGHIYVAGATTSGAISEFPSPIPVPLHASSLVQGELASEAFQPFHAGPGGGVELAPYGSDGFVVGLELDGDSARYHYATFLGGSGDDVIWDIDVDSSGNAFVTGETNSANFPVSDATPEYRGMFTDAFVSKLSLSGADLSYSAVLGGSSTDVGSGIVVDPSGSAHITGWTSNVVCSDPLSLGIMEPPNTCPVEFLVEIADGDFPTQNAYQEHFHGGVAPILGSHPKDAFVAKLTDSSFLSGVSQDVDAMIPFTETVAVFYSPRLDAEAGDFVATIDWADDSPLDNATDVYQVDDHVWEVAGTHRYLEPGAYPILVTVSDTSQENSDENNDGNVLDPAVNANVSRMEAHQAEPTIALDPTDPSRIFVTGFDARTRGFDSKGGILTAYSSDNGRTWTSRIVADENDDLPPAQGTGVATFDQFGNLFLTYPRKGLDSMVVAVSMNGGKTFESLIEIVSSVSTDQPVIATGPSTVGDSSLWIAYRNESTGTIDVIGVPVDDLQAASGNTGVVHKIGVTGRPTDVAVGPDGQVMVIWELPPVNGIKEIYASVDPDGLKVEGLQLPVFVARSQIGSFGLGGFPDRHTAFDAKVAWDRSGGENNGQIHVVYADVGPLHCANDSEPAGVGFARPNVCITSSRDDGKTWSRPQSVIPSSAAETTSRYFPSVTIDQQNSVLAVGWYDTGEDPVRETTRFHVAASNDGGKTFRVSVPVSSGASDRSLTSVERGFRQSSSMDFHTGSGAVYSAWVDNSPLLAGNPNRPQFDIAVAATGIMNVRQVHPKIRPLPIQAEEGKPFLGPVATFTHVDASRKKTDFSAKISWGDGSVSDGTITAGGVGLNSVGGAVFTINGTHTYASEGAHMVWVTVHDNVTDFDSVAVSNISESRTHEAEGVIVIDPSEPDRVFAAAVTVSSTGKDVLASYSDDGGVTWNTSIVGDSDGLPAGSSHPAAAFDEFGNLLFYYAGENEEDVYVALSTDGGQTFPFSFVIPGADYPSVTTGPGGDLADTSVWSIYEAAGVENAQRIVATGARQEFVVAPSENDGFSRRFPEIAIGPQGQVLATYASNLTSPPQIYAHLDPDGLGPMPFGSETPVTQTFFAHHIVETPEYRRSVTAGMNLAWDQSRGEFGRLYMTFTDLANSAFDTDIFLVYSDDAGQSWTGGFQFSVAADKELSVQLNAGILSDDLMAGFLDHGIGLSPAAIVQPVVTNLDLWRIVDDGTRYLVRYNIEQDRFDVELERIPISPDSTAAQFQPSIAVDENTGNVAVGWYSTLGDASGRTTVYRMTVSSDGGGIFSEPLTVSTGRSDANQNGISAYAKEYQYGDYTRIAFVDGIVQPIWGDNSTALPDNPRSSHFEIVNARVGIAHISGVPPVVQANTLTVTEANEFTEVVATFTDPDPDGEAASDYSALIDWGDGHEEMGTIEQDGIGYRVVGTHEYTKKGTYQTTVGITNLTAPYAPPTLAQGTANVADAVLTPINHSLRVTEGVTFTDTIAFFTDGNTNSVPGDFTTTISWGDDTANSIGNIEFLETANGSNSYAVHGSHTYVDEQTYSATVTITENGGATIAASSQIVSGDPPISAIPQGQGSGEINVLEGDFFSGFANGPAGGSLPSMQGPLDDVGLAQFEVLGSVDTYEGAYTAEIDWDDGTFSFPADVSREDNVFTITGQHAFQTGGTLFPTVTLFDDSGGSAVVTLVAHVGRNVTADVTTSGSGLTFNSATNVFHGNVSVLNTSNSNLFGPFLIAFTGLPSNVDLVNKTGVTNDGDPYIESNQGILFAGQSLLSLPVEFTAPGQSDVTYTPNVYAEVPDLQDAQPAQAAQAPFGMAPDASSGFSFESNQGQTDEQVDFLSQGHGYTIFLTPEEAVLRLAGATDLNSEPSISSVVRMRWVDARPDPLVVGLGQQPGASHYVVGNDPEAWQTGIRRYDSVRYHEIYNGIDLVYYGHQGELEYDWIVDPGSDPSQIVVDFSGADGLQLDDAGRLLLQVGNDQLVIRKPVLYQTSGNNRLPVSGGFQPLDEYRVGFDVGPYDPSRTLIIDPVLVYSTYLGGQSRDSGTAIDVDTMGNTYITGFTSSQDFPVFNAVQSTPGGSVAFVTKLDPTGLPVYSSFLGGRGTTRGYGVAADADGHAYVIGETCSADFPTVNALQPEPARASCFVDGFIQADAFIAKFALDGSTLEYSSFLGGSGFDVAFDVDVDDLGSAYVTGRTASPDFPITDQALQPTYAGLDDGFVTKFAPDGSRLEFSTFLGGEARDLPLGIAVDVNGNAHIAGRTTSIDFPNVAAFVTDYRGSEDAFVTKINDDGSAISYSTYLGGSGKDLGLGVAVDGAGNVSVTGLTESADFSTLSPFQATNLGGVDAFVVKLGQFGAGVFATYLGGSGDDEGNGIGTGPDGSVLIAGGTTSPDFPISRSVQSFHRGGGFDGFVTRLQADGQEVSYSTFLGGSGSDELNGIAVDTMGDAFVVGVTESADLRTVNAAQESFVSLASECNPNSPVDCRVVAPDAFVAKIASQGSGRLVVVNRDVTATEGVEFTKIVAAFSDTGSDTPDDYVATIDWADGLTSQGSVTGDGNGNFEISGSHTYDRFGTYAVTVSLLDRDGSVVHPTRTGDDDDDNDGLHRYQVAVDTTELAGTSGFIRLQFNPAVSSQGAGAFAELTVFLSDGMVSDEPDLLGGAQGSLQDVVTLRSDSLLNQLTQAIQFGTEITFDVLLGGEEPSDTNLHSLGNRFALQLLDGDGTTPLLTSHPSGAVLNIDIKPDESVSATALANDDGETVVSTTLTNEVVVGDAPFDAEDVAIDAREGEEFTGIVARFGDSNSLTTAADFTAAIDWGDGGSSAAEIIEEGPGEFAVLGTHSYQKFGDYPLSVRIESLGGRSATAFGAASEVLDIQAARPTVVGRGSNALITDINQDGLPDVVNAEIFFSDQIGVLLGQGDATFQSHEKVSAGLVPSAFALGDFNNDGLPDVVVGDSSDKKLHVLLAAGNATFSDPLLAGQLGGAPASFAPADLNDDGNLDLVAGLGCAPFCAESVSILLGNGDGTFGSELLVGVESGPGLVTVDDVNNDDQPDVIVSNSLAESVSVLLGRGDGSFASSVTTGSLGSVFAYDIGDMNADGNVDLVLGLDDEIVVRAGNGDGTFGLGTTVSAPGQNRVYVIDFNGDGKLDLVASDLGQRFTEPFTPGGVNIVLGNGDGSFQQVSKFSGLTHPNNLGFADFNVDDVLDVVATEDAPFGTIGLLSLVRGDGRGGLIAPVVQSASPKVPPVALPSIRFVLSADLNGDGRDDLVSLNRDSRESEPIVVQLSNGDGTLAASSLYRSGGRGPSSGKIADLNGDSIPDLIVTNLNDPRDVGVLLGSGDGTFAEPNTYTVANPPPTDVAVGDVDEDGIPDLIIAARRSSPVLLGNGDGTFRSPSFIYSGSFTIETVVLADFNGDNHLDIAGLQSPSFNEGGDAVVFLGVGNGRFQSGMSAAIGAHPTSFAVGDFNSDGIPDIAGANEGGISGDPSLSILLGIGDGTFEPVVNYEVPGDVLAIHAADYDGNGQNDIAALYTLGPDDEDPRAIAVFFNVTDGTLPDPRFFHTSSSQTYAITPGDFNGDGGLDIGTANGDQNTVSVILNAVSKSGARVLNSAIDADGTEFSPVVNVEFTATVATFTDTNPFSTVGDFSATIEWGDDSTAQGTVVAGEAGRYHIVGTHTYATTGDYVVSVKVSDAGLVSATVDSISHVSTTDHPINANGTSLTVTEDARFSEVVATFTDQDPNGTIHDFSATILWSDGQTSAGKIVANAAQGFDVVGTHVYALPDVYTVSVSIRSLNGDVTSVVSTATVLSVNDPPRFTSIPGTDVTAESSYSYQVMVQDEDDAVEDLAIVAILAPAWLNLIDHGNGTATLSGVPRRVDMGSHNLELQVSDDERALAMQSFTIVVGVLPHIDNQEFVVPENSLNGSSVGKIAVSDIDAEDVLSFKIVGGNGATTFTIVEETGELTVIDSSQLDFETSPTLEILVNVSDVSGSSDQSQIIIRVGNVNEPPVSSIPAPQNTEEDAALVFNSLSGNTISITDEDVGADNLKVRLTATNGTVHVANGSGLRFRGSTRGSQVTMFGSLADVNAALEGLIFNPAPDFFGTASLQVTVSDLGNSGTGTAQTDDDVIEITVASVNDQPTFNLITNIEMFEDSAPVSLPISGILAGAANEAEQTVTVTATSSNQDLIAPPLISGTGPTRVLNLAPALNANGTTTITITAVDDGGTVAQGIDTFSRQVTLRVIPVNDPPDPSDDYYEVGEDMALDVIAPGVLGNDTTDDILSAMLLIGPSQGSLTLTSDGSFLYTPDLNTFGEDAFIYQATDTGGASVAATARIVVRPINDRPMAQDDEVATDHDTPIVIDVLANDLDVDGELVPNSVRVVKEPTQGTSSVDAINGHVTYVPNGGFVGSDSLTYEVCDDTEPSACGIATVHIEVRLPNHAPMAIDDSAATFEQVPVLIDVLENDVDQDGDLLTVTDFTQGSHGEVTEGVDGLTYLPETNFFGTDTFAYDISDSHGEISTGSVRIEVQPVNDVPQAVSETFFISPNLPFTLTAPGVLANDADADGDILTAALVGHPAHGRVELREDGSFVYAPTVGGQINDSFTYVAQDGSSTSEITTVEIIVAAESVAIVDSEACRAILEIIGDESNPSVVPYGQFGVSCIARVSVSAGGPYSINVGDSLALVGSATYDAEAVEFSWDVNADGTFDDAVGAEPFLTWEQLQSLGIDDPGIFRIILRADDLNGNTGEASAVLVVTDSVPGIVVDPTSGLETSEDGGTATFDIVLTAAPTADVRLTLHSSDASEGTINPDELVFGMDDWNVPQVVTVTGQPDGIEDGDQRFHIVTAWATSLDRNYHGIDPNDISVLNFDGEVLAAAAFLASSDWPDVFLRQLDADGLGDPRYGFQVAANEDQVTVIAWPRLDVLSIMLDTGAIVTSEWLMFVSQRANTVLPEIRSFEFDNLTRTATWSFDGPIPSGDYSVRFGPPTVLADLNSRHVSSFGFGFRPGDVDGNLEIDAADIDVLHTALRGGITTSISDLNTDGAVDATDVRVLVNDILGASFGDANLDGAVDGLDFNVWNRHRFTTNTAWFTADFNGDGVTDGSDLACWFANRFTVSSAAFLNEAAALPRMSRPALPILVESSQARSRPIAEPTQLTLSPNTSLNYPGAGHQSLSNGSRLAQAFEDSFFVDEFLLPSRRKWDRLGDAADRLAKATARINGGQYTETDVDPVVTLDELFALFEPKSRRSSS